ncbi:hypothetical protein ES708_23530 [subsurface metagenome]
MNRLFVLVDILDEGPDPPIEFELVGFLLLYSLVVN